MSNAATYQRIVKFISGKPAYTIEEMKLKNMSNNGNSLNAASSRKTKQLLKNYNKFDQSLKKVR